ncbi:MAG: zinc ABC transporter substrate-binding protein [Sulfuricurvum sp.]|nr:zinc ABC transporter substrate-binding protein [Sulfuricurvum sp.]MDP3022471.1 zinc ABC transporter substrate-binding protein [Sulfuricurvum sp.]MDP3119577.1 zinc ABC transporter substrate-binding protein [Sulfuricurvum sp.]
MMNTKRLIGIGGIIFAVIAGAVFFGTKVQPMKNKSIKPMITVSTFSLYEASREVGGDLVDVEVIVPLGNDPHMFSPNPKQVAQISTSSLFVYNGAGFETWAENIKKTLPASTHVIDMSQYVTLYANQENTHEDHEEHEHRHGAYDPHYWLDINNMSKMVKTMEVKFSKLIPKKEAEFHKNATAYLAKLQTLKTDYTTGLSECKNRTLITNHDAFGYLARANNLKNISIIGLSSDEQPSAKILSEVIALVKEHGITTIFFEEMINDNVAQTIARETGAKAQALQPLENISENELKSHETYESIMRTNLAKLTQAMECR